MSTTSSLCKSSARCTICFFFSNFESDVDGWIVTLKELGEAPKIQKIPWPASLDQPVRSRHVKRPGKPENALVDPSMTRVTSGCGTETHVWKNPDITRATGKPSRLVIPFTPKEATTLSIGQNVAWPISWEPVYHTALKMTRSRDLQGRKTIDDRKCMTTMKRKTPVDFFESFFGKARSVVLCSSNQPFASAHLIWSFYLTILLSISRHHEILRSSPNIGVGFGRHGFRVSWNKFSWESSFYSFGRISVESIGNTTIGDTPPERMLSKKFEISFCIQPIVASLSTAMRVIDRWNECVNGDDELLRILESRQEANAATANSEILVVCWMRPQSLLFWCVSVFLTCSFLSAWNRLFVPYPTSYDEYFWHMVSDLVF